MCNTSPKQIKYIIDTILFPECEDTLTSAIKTSGMSVYSYDSLKVPIRTLNKITLKEYKDLWV